MVNIKNAEGCPKCNSKNFIRIPGTVGAHGSGNNILIGATVIGAVKVSRYLCCECGYLEEWIDDEKDIEKIIKRYK